MTKVLVQKTGFSDMLIDSSLIAAHQALGWTRKRIGISADGLSMDYPQDADLNYKAGITEITAMSVVKYSITPLAVSAVAVHADITLHATDTTVVTTAISNPDVPRTLTVKGNASLIAGNVVIVGKNANGEMISNTIALSGSSEVEGTLAFASVSKITVPAKTNGSGDKVSIGYGKKFGMPQILALTAHILLKLFGGTADSGSLTLDADLSKNLYALDGTPNGATALDLIYLA
jgi:hypothetical protein